MVSQGHIRITNNAGNFFYLSWNCFDVCRRKEIGILIVPERDGKAVTGISTDGTVI